MHIRCPHCRDQVELEGETNIAVVTCSSCGSEFSLIPETEVYSPATRSIGHFELLEQLGSGGFGSVWKARDSKLDRLVALKIPRRDQLDPENAEMFLREARATAQLRHPHIVAVHEVGRENGTLYIVSDFVQGVTLADRLTAGALTPREAAALMAEVAQTLHYAHESGVIHRDLKPSNIMLDGAGKSYLMDFGLAKREAGEITMTMDGKVLGTAAYMSPEQARGEAHDVDRRTDVYSLGVILFELLTGERPFRGNVRMLLHQVIHDEPPSPRKLNNRIPRDLETICLKCLEKESHKRYASAAAVVDDLHRFLNGEPILARPISTPERLWRWCGRNRRVAALSFTVLALLSSLVVGSIVLAVVSRQSALVNRQKHDAERNEQLAKEARDEARLSEQQAIAARFEAQQSEQQAAAARQEAQQNEQQAIAARDEAWKSAEQSRVEKELAEESVKVARLERAQAERTPNSVAEQRGLALDALGGLVTTVQSKLRGTAATQRLRQELLQIAVEGLRKVAKSAESSPVADGMMADAHQQMGDVFQSVGQLADARQQYEQCHSMRLALAETDPDHGAAQRNLARALSKLGDVSRLEGNRELARQHYGEALARRKALSDENAESADARRDLATSYITLGNVSEPQESLSYFSRALQLRQALAASSTDPTTRASRERDVWIVFNRLADVSLRLNDMAAAREHYDQALVLAARLHELLPEDAQAKSDLGTTHMNVGNVRRQAGETVAAKESYAQAANLLRPLAAEDAQNIGLQTNFMSVLARAGEHVEAAQKADAFRTRGSPSSVIWFNLACCYALCLEAVVRDKASDEFSTQEQAWQKSYGDNAIAALRQAIARGLKGTGGVTGDHDLDAIRSHPEYEKVLEELQKAGP